MRPSYDNHAATIALITDITRPLDDRAEHASALLSWLDGGGFAPVPDVDAIRVALANLRAIASEAGSLGYYTVIVGWSDQPTQWHPTDRTGPFAALSRGAFPTERAAMDWARTHLDPDGSWHVRHVPPPVDVLSDVAACLAALLAVILHRPADDGSVW